MVSEVKIDKGPNNLISLISPSSSSLSLRILDPSCPLYWAAGELVEHIYQLVGDQRGEGIRVEHNRAQQKIGE